MTDYTQFDEGVIHMKDVRWETMSGMSWVRAVHEPTGVNVECRETTSQMKNRHLAWKMLENACMKHALAKVGEQARKEAFAKGHPVCYMKDGQMVYEYPDGRIIRA